MIPNLSTALKGWTENVQVYISTKRNKSGIVKETFLPMPIDGNLQMADNDDLKILPEDERHFATWRLLVVEKKTSLKQGDLVKIFYQGEDKYFKVIGVKDNTRSGFARYILQERANDSNLPPEISIPENNVPDNVLMTQDGKYLVAQGGK